jgi:hypothetical protein
MSRPHFMPLLAPQPAQPGLGQRPARTAARAAARAVARVTGRARTAELARRQVICLGISSPVEDCRGTGLADAILRRVLSCGCPVTAVILDLGPATAIDEAACAAILAVSERLAAVGTRLRVAAGARGVPAGLADEAVCQRLGRDAVHPSFRSAVLATYAALPGPGLVMGRVKSALDMEAEVIAAPSAVPAPGAAGPPAEPGTAATYPSTATARPGPARTRTRARTAAAQAGPAAAHPSTAATQAGPGATPPSTAATQVCPAATPPSTAATQAGPGATPPSTAATQAGPAATPPRTAAAQAGTTAAGTSTPLSGHQPSSREADVPHGPGLTPCFTRHGWGGPAGPAVNCDPPESTAEGRTPCLT